MEAIVRVLHFNRGYGAVVSAFHAGMCGVAEHALHGGHSSCFVVCSAERAGVTAGISQCCLTS